MLGLLVEGETERHVVPELLKKLNRKVSKIYGASGKQDLLTNVEKYVRLLLSEGVTEILLCFDADGPDGQRDLANVEEKLKGVNFRGVVPVHALEAWLLADEEALTTVVGERVEVVSDPEAFANPTEVIQSIFRKHGRKMDYVKTRHAKMIAKAARDKRLLRCQSYERSTIQWRD